jgi:hypothetical protein
MSRLDDVASVAIFPAIGIARVGNSPQQYFLGPEIPGMLPFQTHNYRDTEGRILRQATKFRLFGLNSKGEIVRELSSADGEINWKVHVANKKAAWYFFAKALDLEESAGAFYSDTGGIPPVACPRRNLQCTGIERNKLVIDPGPRLISGNNINTNGSEKQYAFDTGTFFDRPVYLGEIQTDHSGHLIFLGGRGHSATVIPGPPSGFANNPGWHDDTSDGPVDANIKLKDGRSLEATGAWVIVAPPDYAPGVRAFVTGYDLLLDVAIRLVPGLRPPRIRFYEHVYPILERISMNQWVNAGLASQFGYGCPTDFTDPNLIQKLSDPGDSARPLRQIIFQSFRNPKYEVMDANGWPPVYGDAVSLDFTTRDPREWMAIPKSQYEWLRLWAQGDFEQDLPIKAKTWDEMAPAERANAVTRANLEETIGGPFHPGCEFTWPMRNNIMYEAPFRIKRRTGPEPDFGDELTSSLAMMPGGPLDGSVPGSLTRWMACPWQTDTASCLSAYKAYAGEYLPTFWPARVPNDVVTEEAYRIITDQSSSPAEKERAFSIASRKKWLRGIVYNDDSPPSKISVPNPRQIFLDHWPEVGIVVRKPGPEHTSICPKNLWVETGRTFPSSVPNAVAESLPSWMRNLLSQR